MRCTPVLHCPSAVGSDRHVLAYKTLCRDHTPAAAIGGGTATLLPFRLLRRAAWVRALVLTHAVRGARACTVSPMCAARGTRGRGGGQAAPCACRLIVRPRCTPAHAPPATRQCRERESSAACPSLRDLPRASLPA
ncbi:hypothetical protein EON67_11520, partial [archaeon]